MEHLRSLGKRAANKVGAAVDAAASVLRVHSGVMDIIVVHQPDTSLVSTDWHVHVGWDALGGVLVNETPQVRVYINNTLRPSLEMFVASDGRCVFKLDRDGEAVSSFVRQSKYVLPPDGALEESELDEGKNTVRFEIVGAKSIFEEECNLFLWDSYDKVVVCNIEGVLIHRDTLSKSTGALTLGRHSGYSMGCEQVREHVCEVLSYLQISGYRLLFLSTSPITLVPKIRRRLALIDEQARRTAVASTLGLPQGALITCPDRTVVHAVKGLWRGDQAAKAGALGHVERAFGANLSQRCSQDASSRDSYSAEEVMGVDKKVFVGGFADGEAAAQSLEALGVARDSIFVVDSRGKLHLTTNAETHAFRAYQDLLPHLPKAFPPVNDNCVTPAAFVNASKLRDCSGDEPVNAQSSCTGDEDDDDMPAEAGGFDEDDHNEDEAVDTLPASQQSPSPSHNVDNTSSPASGGSMTTFASADKTHAAYQSYASDSSADELVPSSSTTPKAVRALFPDDMPVKALKTNSAEDETRRVGKELRWGEEEDAESGAETDKNAGNGFVNGEENAEKDVNGKGGKGIRWAVELEVHDTDRTEGRGGGSPQQGKRQVVSNWVAGVLGHGDKNGEVKSSSQLSSPVVLPSPILRNGSSGSTTLFSSRSATLGHVPSSPSKGVAWGDGDVQLWGDGDVQLWGDGDVQLSPTDNLTRNGGHVPLSSPNTGGTVHRHVLLSPNSRVSSNGQVSPENFMAYNGHVTQSPSNGTTSQSPLSSGCSHPTLLQQLKSARMQGGSPAVTQTGLNDSDSPSFGPDLRSPVSTEQSQHAPRGKSVKICFDTAVSSDDIDTADVISSSESSPENVAKERKPSETGGRVGFDVGKEGGQLLLQSKQSDVEVIGVSKVPENERAVPVAGLKDSETDDEWM